MAASKKLPTFNFDQGERILCYHGECLYDGKVLLREIQKKCLVQYRIHYIGWNKKWDEWVPEARLLKYNEENIELQRNLQPEQPKAKVSKKKTSAKTNLKTKSQPNSNLNDKKYEESSEPGTSRALRNLVNPLQSQNHEPIGIGKVNREEESPSDLVPENSNVENIEPKNNIAVKQPKVKVSKMKSSIQTALKKKAQAAPYLKVEKVDESLETAPSTSQTNELIGINEIKTEKKPRIELACVPKVEVKAEADAEENNVSSNKSYMVESVGRKKVKTIFIYIPMCLKVHLCSDWETVKSDRVQHKIPALITVQDIINGYLDSKRSVVVLKSGETVLKETMKDFTNGILAYFNKVLYSKLLYSCERDQFRKVSKDNPGKPFSEIYGFIHLVRLFVKLGKILEMLNANHHQMGLLLTNVDDLIAYLAENALAFVPKF